MTSCDFCGKPVSPAAIGTLHYVSGWAEYRGSTGGAHGLELKESHDRYMHRHCLSQMKRGISRGQGTMEGMAA